MPIYEYRCESCGGITSELILRHEDEEGVRCGHCSGCQLVRVISRVAIHRTEAQRLSEMNTGGPRDNAFYRDSRNVGLWAKKRAQELGADLGPRFDEVVEQARTGKILDDYGS
jgi:putative FmdB family regulatory protein